MKKLSILFFAFIISLGLHFQNAQAQDTFGLEITPVSVSNDNTVTIQYSTYANSDCFIRFGPTQYLAETGAKSSIYNPLSTSYNSSSGRKSYSTTFSNIATHTDYYYKIICTNETDSYSTPVYTIESTSNYLLNPTLSSVAQKYVSENKAELIFSTEILTDCEVTYSNLPSSSIRYHKYAAETQDGRFQYLVEAEQLQKNQSYLYSISCNYNNQLYSKQFAYTHSPSLEQMNFTMEDIEGNFRDTAYELTFSIPQEAQCMVRISETRLGLIDAEPMETITVTPPSNTPSTNTRMFHMAWWYNLPENTDFHYEIECTSSGSTYYSPIGTIYHSQPYTSDYPESWIDNNVITPVEKQKVTNDVSGNIGSQHKGKLFLQVEDRGRIWYINPADSRRYEVTFENALALFEELAVGISNNDLEKIPMSSMNTPVGVDSDNDGYSDLQEIISGYNPYGFGKFTTDINFSQKQKGRLFLQVEDQGRIWYVDFEGKRHEVTWDNLLPLFKSLSIGITNNDLEKISSVEYR